MTAPFSIWELHQFLLPHKSSLQHTICWRIQLEAVEVRCRRGKEGLCLRKTEKRKATKKESNVWNYNLALPTLGAWSSVLPARTLPFATLALFQSCWRLPLVMNPEGKFLSVTPAPKTLCEQVMLMTRLFVQKPLCTCMFITNLWVLVNCNYNPCLFIFMP